VHAQVQAVETACFFSEVNHIARQLRINQRIRAREVRLINEAGEQLGILPLREALDLATEQNVDLVEVSPTSHPPVCRLMDYGKFKYEQQKKDRDARLRRRNLELREVKVRPKIDKHDYAVKCKTARRLLEEGDKVKVTMMFRGREVIHNDMAEKLLLKMAEDVQDLAVVERRPKLEGRNMIMILTPKV